MLVTKRHAGVYSQTGFTLIEVLIALFIASVSLVGLLAYTQNATSSLGDRQQTTLANIVVNNLAIETRLSNRPSIGKEDGEYSLANRSWPYQKVTTQVELLDVTKTVISVYGTKDKKNAKQPSATIELYLPTVNIEKQ